MRAMVIHEHGAADKLRLETMPDPVAGAGQVVIRVMAAGVNPADHKHRSGMFKDFVAYPFPYVGGYDVAGVVETVGEGVTALRPGMRVLALLDPMKAGGYAEFTLTDASNCAEIPAELGFEQAAVIPCSGLTGLQSVDEVLRPKKGDRVLVTGATGMVGRFAVFAAKAAGAHVTAAVRSAYADEARQAGADEIAILGEEWRGEPFDGVIDTIGGPASSLVAHARPDAAILTAATDPLDSSQLASQPVYIAVHPDGPQLARLAAAAAEGRITVPIVERYPLAEAGEAQTRMETGGIRGKIVLNIG